MSSYFTTKSIIIGLHAIANVGFVTSIATTAVGLYTGKINTKVYRNVAIGGACTFVAGIVGAETVRYLNKTDAVNNTEQNIISG